MRETRALAEVGFLGWARMNNLCQKVLKDKRKECAKEINEPTPESKHPNASANNLSNKVNSIVIDYNQNIKQKSMKVYRSK